jgi:hypothetical protein
MVQLRWLACLVILGALAGGVAARLRYAEADEKRPAPTPPAGFAMVEEFFEPLSGLRGFEIAAPRCSRPIAVLPVATLAIPPEAFSYPGARNCRVSYAYDGHVFPETTSSLPLRALHAANLLRAMFGLADARAVRFYLKLWTPRGCAELSPEIAAKLQRSFSMGAPGVERGRSEQKPL